MLALTDVTFKYEGSNRPSLSDLSIKVDKGELLGLLGINGAGKSTLVSLLTGVLAPDSGSVLIDGERATLGRRDIAYVPQEYAFYEELSVVQNLNYFAAILYPNSKTQRRASTARCIDQCHLLDIVNKRPEQCSGGEKRRLNLAIALLKVPQLLILDEPTANVDPQARQFIVGLVKALNEQGVTIIYTSHLLDEVQQLCSKIALIHQGRLLRFGSTDALLDGPARSLVVETSGINSEQQEKLNAAFGSAISFVDSECRLDLNGCSIPFSEAIATIEKLVVGVKGIRTERASLEAVFLSLVQQEQVL